MPSDDRWCAGCGRKITGQELSDPTFICPKCHTDFWMHSELLLKHPPNKVLGMLFVLGFLLGAVMPLFLAMYWPQYTFFFIMVSVVTLLVYAYVLKWR